MKKTISLISSIVIIVIFTFLPQSISANVIYVKSDAVGANDGSSWINAYVSLQSAIDVAVSGDQIWVSKGIYIPSYDYGLGDIRYNHFRLVENVAIYGGFAGTETDVSQRIDFSYGGANETVLSGDLNGDDIVSGEGNSLSFSNNADNCYHVLYLPNTITPTLTNLAIIDGFTITGGNANGVVSPHGSGGGILITYCSPTLNNLTIIYNSANGGAGITMTGSETLLGDNNTKLTNSIIKNNLCAGSGAGVNIANGGPDLEVINCIISGNKTTLNPGSFNQGGAGIRIYHRGKITNCLVTDNHAPTCNAGGGGIFIDWGTFFGSQGIILTGCTFAHNHALNGGGTNYTQTGGLFRNCILWGNTDQNGVSNYIGSTFVYCNTSPLPVGDGNISSDPLFVDADSKDFRLFGTSPCADAGNNSYNSQLYDVRGPGFDRLLNKADGGVGTIDIGAYEYKYGIDPPDFCLNPSSGGEIGFDQQICYGEMPDLIVNIESPEGFYGDVEYKWQQSTESDISGFSDIPDSNNIDFQSSTLYLTTWYKRLSRVSCETDWSGASVSNVIQIVINPVYSFTESHSICQGETYTWQGSDYTEANTYTASFLSVNGCDSIYTLNLTVNTIYEFTESATICDDESYFWQGENFGGVSDVITVNYASQFGCDSIYTLNLTVNPSYTFEEMLEICEGETFEWQGETYTAGGFLAYQHDYVTEFGCDSIYILHMFINELPEVDFIGLDAIYCNNASISVLTGNPDGGVFSGAGIIGNEFNPATAGVGSWEITYTYSDGNDCGNTAMQTVQVNDCSTIETEISGDIQVYPNPNSGEFKITIPQSGDYKLSIYNSLGQIVWSESITVTDQNEISINGLAPGAYVLQLVNDIATDNIKILVK
jgi:hypothetical protein